MTLAEAKQRIKKLRESINHHRYLYHVLDTQDISDAALDSLKHELKQLEDTFPDLITPDSPTQRVAGKPLDKFTKVEHDPPMLSLEDIFSEEEFVEWVTRIQKLVPDEKLDFFGELKFDGIAVSLKYENGVFVEGSTRGDGRVGEDVTQNIRTIESVPLSLNLATRPQLGGRVAKLPKIIEVRGEVVITKKNFEAINREQEKNGEKIYANPRNLAAGSIRQLDPKMAAARKLDFIAYNLVAELGQTQHNEAHELMRKLGFKADKRERVLKTIEDVFSFRNEVEKDREKLPYHIDGIVINVNNNELFGRLGVIGKAPRGAIAFKYAPLEATTIVEEIKIQVGRTGVLTPIAYLQPVLVGGVTISRATLHNEDEIKRLGLKIGDTVIVGRAGDVIPDIRQVLVDLRTGKEKSFRMPMHCPVCSKPVVRKDGEVAYRCVNTNCPALQREGLYHFVSRKGFDIDGLGPKIINVLLDQNLIQDAPDLYELEEGDLAPLERFGEKSAKNLILAIQNRKMVSLPRFIYSLGILHVGEETAVVLARNIPAAAKAKAGKQKNITPAQFANYFKEVSLEDLQRMPDIGPIVAQSIYMWFHTEHNLKLLEKFEKVGVTLEVPKVTVVQNSALRGKRFVFTGEMEQLSRDDAKEKVRAFGGEVSDSVSKKTDFVVIGNAPGSKYDKASQLGVKILSEKEFLQMLN